MADKSDDLIISISTDVATLRRSLKRIESAIGDTSNVAVRKFDKLGQDIDRSTTRSLKGIENAYSSLGRKIAGVFAVIGSARGAQQLIDSAIGIQNALKVAGVEGDNLKKVYDALFASAQRNAAPVEALVTLYSKLALSQKELGVSQNELLKFTDTVSVALRVGGTSALEARGALLQLSQALGGGVVRAEEFNSVLEGAPTILQAAAAGIKEAEGSVAKLRKIMLDGNLSSKALFDGTIAGAASLEAKLKGAEATISQRLVRLSNVLIDTAKEFNTSTTAGETFGTAIDDLAKDIGDIDFDGLIRKIQGVVKALNDGAGDLKSWAKAAGEATGAASIGRMLAGPTGTRDVFAGTPLEGAFVIKSLDTPEQRALDVSEQRLDIEKKIQAVRAGGGFGGSLTDDSPEMKVAALERRLAALPTPEQAANKPAFKYPARPFTPTPVNVKTVSIKDYPVDGDGKTKSKEEKAASSAKKAYDALVKSADDRIGQLRLESELLGEYGAATDAARFRLDLLQQSEDKGRSLSEGQKAEIEAKVELYKKYSEALGQAKLKQDLLDDAKFAGMSKQDQAITQRLRSYGLSEDLGSDNANAIRNRFQQEEIADATKSFLTDFSTGIVSGGKDIGEAFVDALRNAAANAMQKSLDSLFEQIGNGLASALMGGKAASPVGAIASTASSFAAPVGAVERSALPAAGNIGAYAKAIQAIESGGNYGAMGPVTRNGDRAYGAYQVMGNNIPSWSKEALGKSMTASEFLSDKGAQDSIFAHKFGGYAEKYGAGGAAQAWFGGPGSVGKGGMGADILGTTGNKYVEKFNTQIAKMGDTAAGTVGGLGQLNGGLAAISQNFGGGAGLGGGFASLFSSSFKPNTTLSAFLGVGANAKGTDSWSGGPTWVGEDGPEIINAPKGAQIIPRHAIRKVQAPVAPRLNTRQSAAANNNGSSVLNVNINGASGDAHIRELTRQGVAQALAEKNDNDRRGGFGTTQQRYYAQKG